MSRLIWKELREHYKLALLVMLGLAAAELFALFNDTGSTGDLYFNHGITISREEFKLVTTFGSAAVGLLLGFVQILPELKRDRWASLLHRPAPRSHLFFGKAIAGVLLYGIATIPPLLLCVYFAATPGYFPSPFVPGLAFGSIVDTAAGLVYYFAALLIALQRGGDFGLRALPLFAAVYVTLFVRETPGFQEALWAAALMAAVLALAGCGAMVHRDLWAARPWPARIALLIVAFYGLCGLFDIVHQAVYVTVRQNYSASSYEISEEGRPLRLNQKNGTVVSVEELDGSTPTDPKYKPDQVRSHVHFLRNCSFYIGESHGWQYPEFPRSYRSSTTFLTPARFFTHPQPELWFYLVQKRSMVGISLRTRKPVVRFDSHGFQPPNAQITPIPGDITVDYNQGYGFCLRSPDRARFVDLPSRKITEVSMPVPGPIFGATRVWVNTETGAVQTMAFALRTGVAFYDENDGHLVAMIPYHQEMDRWGSVGVGASRTRERFHLMYSPSFWMPFTVQRSLPSYVEEMDAQGNLLHAYTLPPIPRQSRPVPQILVIAKYGQSPASFFGKMLYQEISVLLGGNRPRDFWAEIFGVDSALATKRITFAVLLSSFICAGVTLAWARRVHFPWLQAWRWAGLTLALNVAGLIIFRLVADWPRFVPCAGCHQPRPLHQSTCPHCAEGWPAATPTGVEIFDNAYVGAEKSAATV